MSDDTPTPNDAAADYPDFGEYQDRADEIGLLAANITAPRSIAADFEEVGYEYEQTDEFQAWSGQLVEVYRYDRDGETRWAACWSERFSIDEVVYDSLIFDSEPTESDVEQGAEIVNARDA